jgi:hypothetical protein
MARSFCKEIDCEIIPVCRRKEDGGKRVTMRGVCKTSVRCPLARDAHGAIDSNLAPYSRAECGTSTTYRSRSVGDRDVGQKHLSRKARRGSFGVQPRRRAGRGSAAHAARMPQNFPLPLTRSITLQSSTRGPCSLTLWWSRDQVAEEDSSAEIRVSNSTPF